VARSMARRASLTPISPPGRWADSFRQTISQISRPHGRAPSRTRAGGCGAASRPRAAPVGGLTPATPVAVPAPAHRVASLIRPPPSSSSPSGQATPWSGAPPGATIRRPPPRCAISGWHQSQPRGHSRRSSRSRHPLQFRPERRCRRTASGVSASSAPAQHRRIERRRPRRAPAGRLTGHQRGADSVIAGSTPRSRLRRLA